MTAHTYIIRIYNNVSGDLINVVSGLAMADAERRASRSIYCGHDVIIDRDDCRPGLFSDAGRSVMATVARMRYVGPEQFNRELSMAFQKMECAP